ncbi:KilA-N domain-containing protein [Myxococcus sp. AB025B]|uniref:KilA-N domain-containing protein n=1 Tax=Myxococcus sp. AB025B TaxID=2562794 RepID=UPI00114471E4|nr:KilA-N domain-containing protein [Myxococcus sp. AB025B]
MSCPSQQLVIGDVVVQQDDHGRYSLNDLHRAAGGEPRPQPSACGREYGGSEP